MLDVYGLLGAQLMPLTRYRELFKKYPSAVECLVNIYEDIQRFHSLSYKLFSLTAKCLTARSLLHPNTADFISMATPSKAHLGGLRAKVRKNLRVPQKYC